jgi:hypothetical protein
LNFDAIKNFESLLEFVDLSYPIGGGSEISVNAADGLE